ncbi:RNA-protein complex protein Nop10 [Infirmifilum sp. NZ]|uniref:RNA-protein complex protein Nop10 n=1 Tax=Infirmifilum sp. NZ TaxID=2926850 RepID=UPI003FA384E1
MDSLLLHRCPSCGMYTLRRDKCPYCGGTPGAAHPAKFSPEDPYGEYRPDRYLHRTGKAFTAC